MFLTVKLNFELKMSPQTEFCVSFFLVAGQFAEADIAKSLLHMISNDIGQVS